MSIKFFNIYRRINTRLIGKAKKMRKRENFWIRGEIREKDIFYYSFTN